jgi:hypothetical protein
MIEIRNVSKAGTKCNVEHPFPFHNQLRRRAAQPNSPDTDAA